MADANYKTNQNIWLDGKKIDLGSKVVLTRGCNSYENGWGTFWSDKMNEYIGQTGTIETIFPGSTGIGVRFNSVDSIFAYPYFVLEPVGKVEEDLRLPLLD